MFHLPSFRFFSKKKHLEIFLKINRYYLFISKTVVLETLEFITSPLYNISLFAFFLYINLFTWKLKDNKTLPQDIIYLVCFLVIIKQDEIR